MLESISISSSFSFDCFILSKIPIFLFSEFSIKEEFEISWYSLRLKIYADIFSLNFISLTVILNFVFLLKSWVSENPDELIALFEKWNSERNVSLNGAFKIWVKLSCFSIILLLSFIGFLFRFSILFILL